MVEGGVLVVGALNDGIYGTGFLAETAENALSHVDVVLGGPPGAVGSGLGLDLDGEGGTVGFAELAGDAALFTCGVASERVLASEVDAERAFLPGIVDDRIRLVGSPHYRENSRPGQLSRKHGRIVGFSYVGVVYVVGQLVAVLQPNVALVLQRLGVEGVRVVVLGVRIFGVNQRSKSRLSYPCLRCPAL